MSRSKQLGAALQNSASSAPAARGWQDTFGGAHYVPIDGVRPDPAQPRQLLPPELAGAFRAGELTPVEVIARWEQAATAPHASRAQRNAWAAVRELAESIARQGLINAPTVRAVEPGEAPGGVQYMVVTGERRYWAHVLLHAEKRPIQQGSEVRPAEFLRVEPTAPGTNVRAHQLIENLQREDINAVEKARGMWALRLALANVNYSSHEEPTERAEAAKAVPWKAVEEALGISRRYRSYVTAVLTLPPDALALVEAHGLSEAMIRPVVEALRGYPALQVAALEQVVAWQEAEGEEGPGGSLVRSVKELTRRLLRQVEGAVEAPADDAGDGAASPGGQAAEQLGRRLGKVLRFLSVESEAFRGLATELAARPEALAQVRELRDQLDALLAQAEGEAV